MYSLLMVSLYEIFFRNWILRKEAITMRKFMKMIFTFSQNFALICFRKNAKLLHNKQLFCFLRTVSEKKIQPGSLTNSQTRGLTVQPGGWTCNQAVERATRRLNLQPGGWMCNQVVDYASKCWRCNQGVKCATRWLNVQQDGWICNQAVKRKSRPRAARANRGLKVQPDRLTCNKRFGHATRLNVQPGG